MNKQIKLNERQIAIIKTLEGAEKPLTLSEISAQVGFTVKSGTTNSLVKANYITMVGKREIVCPTCGHKHKVGEYAIGTKKAE